MNQTREELPLDAPTEPGSLRTLTGQTYDRAALLGSLLFRLERIYDGWRHGGLTALYGEIGARDFLRGRRITVDGEAATALQILRDGRLEIATGNGHGRDARDRVGRGAVRRASCRRPSRADEKIDHDTAIGTMHAPEPPPERLRCSCSSGFSSNSAAGRPRRTAAASLTSKASGSSSSTSTD